MTNHKRKRPDALTPRTIGLLLIGLIAIASVVVYGLTQRDGKMPDRDVPGATTGAGKRSLAE
jgi:hypothetical protein